MKHSACLPFLTLAFLASGLSHAAARLGETEAQSQARYGPPAPELALPTDKPLMTGATETIYRFEGWRIRAAFANSSTARIEYAHLPAEGGGLPKALTEPELKAILEAEKGSGNWKEEKGDARGGRGGLFGTGGRRNDEGGDLAALGKFFNGRSWQRSDHAQAKLRFGLVLELETKDADAIEKKLAHPSSGKPAPAGPPLPKF